MILLHCLSNWSIISAPLLFKKATPSQINMIKKAKNHFLLVKKLKTTESAQLWATLTPPYDLTRPVYK